MVGVCLTRGCLLWGKTNDVTVTVTVTVSAAAAALRDHVAAIPASVQTHVIAKIEPVIDITARGLSRPLSNSCHILYTSVLDNYGVPSWGCVIVGRKIK